MFEDLHNVRRRRADDGNQRLLQIPPVRAGPALAPHSLLELGLSPRQVARFRKALNPLRSVRLDDAELETVGI